MEDAKINFDNVLALLNLAKNNPENVQPDPSQSSQTQIYHLQTS